MSPGTASTHAWCGGCAASCTRVERTGGSSAASVLAARLWSHSSPARAAHSGARERQGERVGGEAPHRLEARGVVAIEMQRAGEVLNARVPDGEGDGVRLARRRCRRAALDVNAIHGRRLRHVWPLRVSPNCATRAGYSVRGPGATRWAARSRRHAATALLRTADCAAAPEHQTTYTTLERSRLVRDTQKHAASAAFKWSSARPRPSVLWPLASSRELARAHP